MLKLLSSYWFVALGSLILPLLIHLWNKRQPKVIKVGSLKWLSTGVNTKSRQLQFQDLPLLLLRCLLLTLLVIYLMQPFWQRLIKPTSTKYAWVAPELLQQKNLPLIQTTLDSLVAQQYDIYQFKSGLPIISADEWIKLKTSSSILPDTKMPENYWQLARQVQHNFPKASQHIILTSNQLNNFIGERPSLNNSFRWIILPLEKKANWVQKAWQITSDSLLLTLGKSSATGTHFTNHTVPFPAINQALNITNHPELIFIQESNKPVILNKSSGLKTYIDIAAFKVGIVISPDRKTDAQYIKGAISAIKSFTGEPVILREFKEENISNIKNLDFLFWLSNSPIPEVLNTQINSGLFILKDAPTNTKRFSNGWLKSKFFNESISLNKQIDFSNQKNIGLWQNNFGEPILYLEPNGKGGIYHFTSRFNKQWNDLPESSQFPEIIGSLLWPESKNKHDLWVISEQQAQPIILSSTTFKAGLIFESLDLKYWFLGLAALLFLLERFWSFRKERKAL